MQKTVIVVKGETNSGKTSSIKIAYEKLIENERPIQTVEFKFIDCCDFRSVLILLNHRIGFLSYGDEYKKLKQHITALKESQCSIIICACSVKEMGDDEAETCKAISSLEPEYEIKFIDKPRSKHRLKKYRNAENMSFAEKSYNSIIRAINEN